MARPFLAVLATLLVVSAAGCAGQAAAPRSSPGSTPATVTAWPAASPSDPLPFPTARAKRLEHARYAAAPPFDLRLTFTTPGQDWETLHLLGEFTDVVRWAGASRDGPPMRWIAFAHPTRIRGDTDVPAAGLDAAGVAALLTERDDLEATDPEPFSVAGVDGVRLDLHAQRPDTIIFGGPGGELGMEPSRSTRVGIVVVEEEPLLIFVFAPPDELEQAWDEAGPLLDSVEL